MNKYVRIAITGLLLSVIAWKTNWGAVGQAFANLNVSYWLAAVALLCVAQIVSAFRWQVFARELGMNRSVWQLAKLYFVGMYFNLCLPSSVGGDVARAWYLDGNSGQKLRAAASVFLDRISGLVALVAMACVAVLFAPPQIPSWVPLSVYGIAAAGFCGVCGIAAFARWGRLPENRRQQLNILWDVVRHPRDLLVTSALSLVVQLASATIVWLVGEGLHAGIPFTYYAVFVPMVSLLTLIPLTVNGIGVREEGFVIFLAPLGISKDLAVALGILWFAVQIAVSLLGGLVYLFGLEKGAGTLSSDTDSEKEVAHGPVDRDSDQGRTRQLDRAA